MINGDMNHCHKRSYRTSEKRQIISVNFGKLGSGEKIQGFKKEYKVELGFVQLTE